MEGKVKDFNAYELSETTITCIVHPAELLLTHPTTNAPDLAVEGVVCSPRVLSPQVVRSD